MQRNDPLRLPPSYWINKLQLEPHVEGGWYREVYRSSLSLQHESLGSQWQGPRPAATHIYFLLEQGNFSAFHRISSDELWHFYGGGPLNVYEIHPSGTLTVHQLGNEENTGQTVFSVIRGGSWFGAAPASGTGYSLVGCTVSPGFDFADFELARKQELQAAFPAHADLIASLCRD